MSFDWTFFFDKLFFPEEEYLWGLFRTMTIAIFAMLLGTAIGFIVGFGRLSKIAIIRSLAGLYVWIIRGIPPLVILVLIFVGAAAAGLPRFEEFSLGSLDVAGNYQAAVIGLAIHTGAYMAEIIRNGIQSVLPGQIEAAKALGMSPSEIARRIVVPQATRVIIPPAGNEFNVLIKLTSLVSVIGVQEIFLISQSVASNTFRVFEMMIIVSISYLVLTGFWSVVQGVVEIKIRAFEAPIPAYTWRQAISHFFKKPGIPDRKVVTTRA
ncbi:amino acid ABC transporter permease [Candidatus Aquiluna sp. UB-MaderosW2red]|uniref:amino acid ABC transporter permease n=1 Tax=Candidatus Aquiluna sp. UB-MaderosW2red TaxID=1855377 RepID=UPI000875B8E5|nr:amino acid ABC transporter permease [Candidatus Aquiluna sp. UB-MaderosW2red]SCX03570.1 polar amino acid transport system permease protein [Candidatus Aquiluna sp. UB-MaderosW2red]